MEVIALIFLIILLILFVIFVINMIIKKNRSTDNVYDDNFVEKIDLSRWRGGVRYPVGYYKKENEFHKIEKKLRYSK